MGHCCDSEYRRKWGGGGGQDRVSDCKCLTKGRNKHFVFLLFPGLHHLHFCGVPTLVFLVTRQSECECERKK